MNIFENAKKQLNANEPDKAIIERALELGRIYQAIEQSYRESEELLNKKKYDDYRKITSKREMLKRQAKNIEARKEETEDEKYDY